MHSVLEIIIGSFWLEHGLASSRDGKNLMHQVGGLQGALEQKAGRKLMHVNIQLGGVLGEVEEDKQFHVAQVDVGRGLACTWKLRASACKIWKRDAGDGAGIAGSDDGLGVGRVWRCDCCRWG